VEGRGRQDLRQQAHRAARVLQLARLEPRQPRLQPRGLLLVLDRVRELDVQLEEPGQRLVLAGLAQQPLEQLDGVAVGGQVLQDLAVAGDGQALVAQRLLGDLRRLEEQLRLGLRPGSSAARRVSARRAGHGCRRAGGPDQPAEQRGVVGPAPRELGEGVGGELGAPQLLGVEVRDPRQSSVARGSPMPPSSRSS
jgi:hypothetical protein